MNAPLVTVWLVIANLVVYAAQAFLGDRVLLRLALWPPGEHLLGMIGERRIVAGFEPHQLLSYGFLHTDVVHLVFNLVGLVDLLLNLGRGIRLQVASQLGAAWFGPAFVVPAMLVIHILVFVLLARGKAGAGLPRSSG